MKTYGYGPPVTKFADGVGQDEHSEPEDRQELTEERKDKKHSRRNHVVGLIWFICV